MLVHCAEKSPLNGPHERSTSNSIVSSTHNTTAKCDVNKFTMHHNLFSPFSAIEAMELGEDITCAICMENRPQFCLLPCCFKSDSSVQFCVHCIKELCSRSAIQSFSCPSCREFVGLDSGCLVLKKNVNTCSMCKTVNYMANPKADSHMCYRCLTRVHVMRHLRYECEQCHGLQRFHQPVWRYQLTTTSFTSVANWTCHGCGVFSSWRLLQEDVPLVLEEDRPASWNTADNKFCEIIEALDVAKTKSIERRAGFWSGVYMTVCTLGAVIVLDKVVTKLLNAKM